MNILSQDEGFLRDINNDTNYRILLALALEATRGSSHPMLELGPCDGSTPFLHAYCENEARPLVSIDENLLEVIKFSHLRTTRHDIACHAWSSAPIESQIWSVAFIKHSPGDRRWADAMRLHSRCAIIVLHDTQPAANGAVDRDGAWQGGYGFSRIWPEFKYKVDVKSDGTWASAVSNSIDLTAWRGRQFGRYTVSGDTDDAKIDPMQESVRQFLNARG